MPTARLAPGPGDGRCPKTDRADRATVPTLGRTVRAGDGLGHGGTCELPPAGEEAPIGGLGGHTAAGSTPLTTVGVGPARGAIATE